jgi:hypothetical protein
MIQDAPPAEPGGTLASRGRARAWVLPGLAIVAAAALTLMLMGRVPICTCGHVKVWHGVVLSAENSQHLTDWYTFTHVVHGFGFYGLLWLIARRWPIARRFVVAVALESAWEVFENTDFIINRYREATIALDYYGDSVLNSVSDILAMCAGFFLASRLRVLTTVVAAAALETLLASMIRDNLSLNILMLLFPLDIVRVWQAGA